MTVYLCNERGEKFYIEAENAMKAAFGAEMYGAVVLAGPLAKRYLKIDPNTVKVINGKVVK